MIVFNEENHTYQNSETKEYYTSVSKVLSLYKEPFDKEFHASRKAIKEGVTKDEMIAKWDKTNKEACDKGHNVHRIVENFIKDGTVEDNNLIYAFEKIFNKKDYKRVLSEEIVYSDKYKISGTSDMICDVNNNEFDVLDLKTNKKFLFQNNYGKYLKAPLNNLQQCHYNDYSLQLSLYAFLYSGLTNKRVRKICILYHDGEKFNSYATPYMFWEIQVLLNHFLNNHGQTVVEQNKSNSK